MNETYKLLMSLAVACVA